MRRGGMIPLLQGPEKGYWSAIFGRIGNFDENT